jgi:SM-20-related protein
MLADDVVIQGIGQRGWAVVPSWLSVPEVADTQPSFDADFRLAQVGKGANLQRDAGIRGDLTAWVDEVPPALAPLWRRAEDLRLRLNRELFLGLGKWEAHLAKYPAGAFYLRHLDRHGQGSTRMLSMIVYLNADWGPDDGGELVLYAGESELVRVPPVGGTLVCFLSADFPHEVLPARRERRSLTGWFHAGGSHVSVV